MAIGPRGVPPILPEAPYAAGSAQGKSTEGKSAEGEHGTAAAAIPQAGTAAHAASALLPHLSALDEAVARALGRQDGLAPLYATLSALSAAPDLPDALRTAVDRLLALRLTAAPDGEALRLAIAASGLFHEAALLAGGAGRGDLKGALGLLVASLSGWLAASRPTEAESRPAGRGKPPPPRRSTPLAGQPVEQAPDLSLTRLAALALDEADRARARILLHQAESLDDERIGAPQAGGKAPLAFELPVALPGGTAVLQMRIEADDRPTGGESGPAERIWRVEFALVPERLGAIVARVGLLPGRRIVVGVWCEDHEAVDRIRAETGPLLAALEAGGLIVSGIDLHLGRPAAAGAEPAPVRHRLDIAL